MIDETELHARVQLAFADLLAAYDPNWPKVVRVKAALSVDEDGDGMLHCLLYLAEPPITEPGFTRAYRPVDHAFRGALAAHGVGRDLELNAYPIMHHDCDVAPPIIPSLPIELCATMIPCSPASARKCL